MNSKERIIIIKIISEINVIGDMLHDYTEEAFLTDEKTQRAVCMTLINIGELAKSLSDEFRMMCTGLDRTGFCGH